MIQLITSRPCTCCICSLYAEKVDRSPFKFKEQSHSTSQAISLKKLSRV